MYIACVKCLIHQPIIEIINYPHTLLLQFAYSQLVIHIHMYISITDTYIILYVCKHPILLFVACNLLSSIFFFYLFCFSSFYYCFSVILCQLLHYDFRHLLPLIADNTIYDLWYIYTYVCVYIRLSKVFMRLINFISQWRKLLEIRIPQLECTYVYMYVNCGACRILRKILIAFSDTKIEL